MAVLLHICLCQNHSCLGGLSSADEFQDLFPAPDELRATVRVLKSPAGGSQAEISGDLRMLLHPLVNLVF